MNLTIYYKDSSFKRVSDVSAIEYYSGQDLLLIDGGPYTSDDPLEIFHFNAVVDYVSLIPEDLDEQKR